MYFKAGFNLEKMKNCLANFCFVHCIKFIGMILSENKNKILNPSYCGPFALTSNITQELIDNYQYINQREIPMDDNDKSLNFFESNEYSTKCKSLIYYNIGVIGESSVMNIFCPIVSSNVYVFLAIFVLAIFFSVHVALVYYLKWRWIQMKLRNSAGDTDDHDHNNDGNNGATHPRLSKQKSANSIIVIDSTLARNGNTSPTANVPQLEDNLSVMKGPVATETRIDDDAVAINKIVVYITNIIMSTISLILLLMNIYESDWVMYDNIFFNSACLINYDLATSERIFEYHKNYAGFVAHLNTVFYILEICYRNKKSFDVILHHFMTIFLMQMALNCVQYSLSPIFAVRIAIIGLLEFATEQPIFLALILRKFEHKYYYQSFIIAIFFHIVTKLICTFGMIYITLVNYDCYYDVYNVSYQSFLQSDVNYDLLFVVCILVTQPLVFILQLYQGYVYYQIANNGKFKQTIVKMTTQEQGAEAPESPKSPFAGKSLHIPVMKNDIGHGNTSTSLASDDSMQIHSVEMNTIDPVDAYHE